MKAVVVYKSKTGYTKKYAQWIAEELGCDIKENASFEDIAGYDIIIYGGGIYVGGINGVRLITGNYNKLRGKKLVLFAVGALSESDNDMPAVWNRLLTEEQQKNIGCFYFRGGFDIDKLGGADKIIMKMLISGLKKNKQPSEKEKTMLAEFDKPVDRTDKDNIKALIQYINGNE